MRLTKTKSHYVADARSVHGGRKYFARTADGKREARDYLKRAEIESATRGAFINPTTTPFFGEAVTAYIEYEDGRARRGELSAAHVSNKIVALNDMGALSYGGKPMNAVRLADLRPGAIVREIIPQLFASGAYATAQKKFVILRHMLQWAVETEILLSNPAAVRLPKKPDALERPVDRISTTQIQAIIDAADDRYRLAIKFAAFTGLRAGEQLALVWDDIDFDAGLVRVNKAVKKDGNIGAPKTKNARRSVPLEPSLLADLRGWRLSQPHAQRGNNLVFPAQDGGLWNTDNLRRQGLTRACKNAGVEVLNWHALRHHFASVLLFYLNESDAVVTSLMGHHSIAFTQKQYGHWMPEARRDEAMSARLESVFRQ